MQVVIIGAGKVGIQLAEALLRREDDVVIVEQNETLAANAAHLPCRIVSGVVIDEDVLKSADIAEADAVCAVTQSDNINIMSTLMARRVFGVKKVVTRLYNPEKKQVFQELGLDTINSTEYTVEAIIREIDGADISARHRLFGRDVVYNCVHATEELIGRKLTDIHTLDGQLVFCVVRGQDVLLNTGGLVVKKDDGILLVDLM